MAQSCKIFFLVNYQYKLYLYFISFMSHLCVCFWIIYYGDGSDHWLYQSIYYKYHMDLCNELYLSDKPASQPSILCGKTFNVEHCTQTFQPYFFHICHAYGQHWLLSLYTTFTDLDLAWMLQGRCWAKPPGFIFLHTFQLLSMKFNIVLLAIQAKGPDTIFDCDLMKQGK